MIEDNFELRRFISGILTDNFQVIEAANSEEGLALGLQRIPDLVITDLMMPLMNGYEVCKGLKQNEKTSHIPVMVLTAKADTDSRIAGLEVLADAYLSKPFDQRELLATINNFIDFRQRLQDKISARKYLENGNREYSIDGTGLLDKIKRSVEAHLDDEQYSLDQLGDEIGLSRTQLHRKVKGLTGQGPGELIRTVRLQRAYELLQQKAGTVSEIAYMVGFSNPNSFSTSFSKISNNKLAAQLSVTKQSASKTIEELEKIGLVRNQRSSSDARSVMLYYTEAGEQFYTHIKTQVMELEDQYKKLVGQKNYDTTIDVLLKMIDFHEDQKKKLVVV